MNHISHQEIKARHINHQETEVRPTSHQETEVRHTSHQETEVRPTSHQSPVSDHNPASARPLPAASPELVSPEVDLVRISSRESLVRLLNLLKLYYGEEEVGERLRLTLTLRKRPALLSGRQKTRKDFLQHLKLALLENREPRVQKLIATFEEDEKTSQAGQDKRNDVEEAIDGLAGDGLAGGVTDQYKLWLFTLLQDPRKYRVQ